MFKERLFKTLPFLIGLTAAGIILGATWKMLQSQEKIVPTNSSGLKDRTIGVIVNSQKAFNGYTLLAPREYTSTYLINNEGKVVHKWESKCKSVQSAYLLENGHLLRSCESTEDTFSGAGGVFSKIEEYDWDGKLVWTFDYLNATRSLHHDFVQLPNGNILALTLEKKSAAQAQAAGYTPGMLTDNFVYADYLIEIQKTGNFGGKIVWEWHVWDHLIQNLNSSKANYGDPSAHPERIDITKSSLDITDKYWTHINSVDYNPKFNQILLGVRGTSEIWIIDRKTGGLVYRWGNPQIYGAGAAKDQKFFQQHDAQWIKDGSPGAGDILVFNNGGTMRNYSSVDEITPPIDTNGNYFLVPGKAFGPANETWTYSAPNPSDFFSQTISGAQRLPNGNTIIDNGTWGIFFEVTKDKKIVWKYIFPINTDAMLSQDKTEKIDARSSGTNPIFKVRKYAPDYPGLTNLKI
jgi:hypothetical protein